MGIKSKLSWKCIRIYIFRAFYFGISITALIISYLSYQYASLKPSLDFTYESFISDHATFGTIINSKILFDPYPSMYFMNTNRANKIMIKNTSKVVADKVYIDISVADPFLIASISLGRLYPIRYQEIRADDTNKNVSIILRRILAHDSCNIFFSYAYPKKFKKKSLVKPDSLIITVEFSERSVKKTFSLEY